MSLLRRFKNRLRGLDRLPVRDDPRTWTEWAVLRLNGSPMFAGNDLDDPARRTRALREANALAIGGHCWIGQRTTTAGPWVETYNPRWMQECSPSEVGVDGIEWRVLSRVGNPVCLNRWEAHRNAAAMHAGGAERCRVAYRTLTHTPWMRSDNEGRSTVGAAGYGRHVGVRS